MRDYQELAFRAYGQACEFDGCGWKEATCDVHHINYPLQQDLEKRLREAQRSGDVKTVTELFQLAYSKGFRKFDRMTMQLEKDDRVSNLAVLCPNHHRYVHHLDMGLGLLSYVPKRKL